MDLMVISVVKLVNKSVVFVLTVDYSIFKKLMKNIVQNLSENVLHAFDHFKCLNSLALQTYGLGHAKAFKREKFRPFE